MLKTCHVCFCEKCALPWNVIPCLGTHFLRHWTNTHISVMRGNSDIKKKMRLTMWTIVSLSLLIHPFIYQLMIFNYWDYWSAIQSWRFFTLVLTWTSIEHWYYLWTILVILFPTRAFSVTSFPILNSYNSEHSSIISFCQAAEYSLQIAKH